MEFNEYISHFFKAELFNSSTNLSYIFEEEKKNNFYRWAELNELVRTWQKMILLFHP